MKFAAGRFVAECHVGARNGNSTRLIETHRNGSGEVMAAVVIDLEDLEDVAHVLRRAVGAHQADRKGRG